MLKEDYFCITRRMCSAYVVTYTRDLLMWESYIGRGLSKARASHTRGTFSHIGGADTRPRNQHITWRVSSGCLPTSSTKDALLYYTRIAMSEFARNTLCAPCERVLQVQATKPNIVITRDLKVNYYNENPPNIKHHSTFLEFELCAKEQCHLCLLFLNQVHSDKLDLLRDPAVGSRIAVYYGSNQHISAFDLHLWYEFSDKVQKTELQKGYMMNLHSVATRGSH
jgi:hypothetical protein